MKTRKHFNVMALIANLNRAALAASNQRFAVPLLIIALAFACIACKDEPEPETITKTITVPAITTVANPMDFGEVSSLTGWDADFPSTDVFYTLTLSQGGVTKATVNSVNNATSISASGHSEGVYTLTQAFYYKGSPIPNGSRGTGISISSNTFGAFVVSESVLKVGSGFAGLTLSLTR